MKTSESIKNLTKALLVAQRSIGSAKKDSKNPFFKSTYADLPTVMEVVKQPLNDAGIIVLQPATHRDGKNFISTVLLHADSGEFMESETEVICSKQNDAQAFGAAQTYARRFGLQALLFVPAEDDDGNVASGRQVQKTTSAPAVSKPATVTSAPALAAVATEAPAATVEPLKKSSFRKPAAKPAVTEQQTTSGEWDL